MRRVSMALGIVGLVWAAGLPASAQKEMKLFGKTYKVECATRAQTYKTAAGKEVKIVILPATSDVGDFTQKSYASFFPGADPSKDRLLIGAHQESGVADIAWHGVYMLTGADANGNFTPASATLTEFFGGSGDLGTSGRPISIHFINDENTGVKKDRNVLMMQWTIDDGYRLYDLDSMNTNYGDDALYYRPSRTQNATTEERYADIVPDPNSPFGSEQSYTTLPVDDKKTVVAIGLAEGGGTDIGMWDTKTDAYFPVLTNLTEQTASATIPIAADQTPTSIMHVSGNEYWIIASSPAPNTAGTDLDSQDLYRVQLTLPADPAKGKAGDIKVTVLEKASLLGTPLETSVTGVRGVTKGREVAPGLFRLYFTTVDGQICVATPAP